jgi:hypothetical protein
VIEVIARVPGRLSEFLTLGLQLLAELGVREGAFQLRRARPVRSHLVHALVELDRSYVTESATERWEDWYAARLTERFPSDRVSPQR